MEVQGANRPSQLGTTEQSSQEGTGLGAVLQGCCLVDQAQEQVVKMTANKEKVVAVPIVFHILPDLEENVIGKWERHSEGGSAIETEFNASGGAKPREQPPEVRGI